MNRFKDLRIFFAVGIILGLPITLISQTKPETISGPARTPPERPPWSNPEGMTVMTNGSAGNSSLPPSSVRDIVAPLSDIKTNLNLILTIDTELLLPSSPGNYPVVSRDAFDIHRLAFRLLRALAIANAEDENSSSAQAISREQVQRYIGDLDQAIKVLVNDPVINQPRTVDANLLTEASSKLERIVKLSHQLQKCADDLINLEAKTSGKKKSKPLKSRLPATSKIQLTVECNAWSVNELLKKESRIKSFGAVEIYGVTAQVKTHKFSQSFITQIDDCIADGVEESGAENTHYVTIVNDYKSYEVKGKTFAYQVTYELALTSSGQIRKRYDQPVWFYYVDMGGSGDFALYKGQLLGLVPDWAKDQARKK